MIKQIFAILDHTAQMFSDPFFARNEAEACRIVEQTLDRESTLSLYPEDFTLYHIGEYRCAEGVIDSNDLPMKIIAVSELQRVKQRQDASQIDFVTQQE